MDLLFQLTDKMIKYYEGAPKYIQHFIKVHRFAQLIGIGEGLDAETLFTLEAAALVHDIGIKPADEKFGNHAGPVQEREGVAPAKEMLTELGFEEKVIDRVCYLVAHHHTYTMIDGIDYQILLEADFLVNLFEEGTSQEAVHAALKVFPWTKTGEKICRTMFMVE